MTNTVFCDISEFQKVVDDSYPYKWLSIRSNDGTYRDSHFAQNLAWCKSRVGSKLDAFIVYCVYEPGKDWVGTLKSQVGTPHPRMAVMVDVESWGGKIKGNHSADINVGVSQIASWLGNINRVLGYGNASDLNSIWPQRNLAANHIVLANYVGNPAFPGKIIHQYSSSGTVAPFGHPVDMNSADGYSSADLMKALGLNGSADPAPAPTPTVTAPAFPLPSGYYYGPKSGPKQSVSGYYAPYGGANGATGLRQWQQRMKDRGNAIGVDGLYGPETQRIATNFQKQCGITQDGLIGPDTWSRAWTAPITSAKL